MADRSWLPAGGTLEVDVKQLYCTITFGATGAVSASTGTGKGIKSVVRNSTGNYTITLSDQYQALVGAVLVLLDATNSDPTTVGVACRLASQAVTAATPTVVVQFNGTGTPGAVLDPRNGAQLLVTLHLKNSTL